MTLTSLPGPAEVESVALGEAGIVEGIAIGAVYADLSTSRPSLIRHIGELLAQKGARTLDSPVWGGPPAVSEGRAILLVGGDEDVCRRCQPLLSTIGGQMKRCGLLGSGTVAKLMLNATFETLSMVMAEGFTLGLKGGLEPQALWEIVREARLEETFLDSVASTLLLGDFSPRFTLELAHKDLGLALELADKARVPMGYAAQTHRDFAEAMSRPGWPLLDARCAMRIQEERAGAKFRLPGPTR